jgi:hypothetical protein
MQSTSAEVYLRVVSGGTSYFQSRLAFHPYAQVIRAICTSAPVRSSTPLSRGFNLPTHRSTGFGYPTNDFRELTTSLASCEVADIRFPFGYASLMLNLAIDRNSLARFSKRTIKRCSTPYGASSLSRLIRLLLFGFRLFSPSAKCTFQLSLTLLLRYRSRDVFRVGSLCLPDSRAISNARYSRSSAIPQTYHYGAVTLFSTPFQGTSCSFAREKQSL